MAMLRQFPAILATVLVCLSAASSAPERQVSSAAPRQLSWWSSSSSKSGATSLDADGTTQDAPTSIIATIEDAVYSQLSAKTGQNVNAFAALALGAALLVDGQKGLKWIIVLFVFVLTAFVAKNEFMVASGLGAGDAVTQFVGLEAGVVAGWAALLGMEGIMVGLGGLLGSIAAHWVKSLFLNVFLFFGLNTHLGVFCIYSVCILGGIYIVGQKKYAKVLAWVAPFAGGALVSSALSFFATRFALGGSMDSLYKAFPETMSPVGGPWIDFFLLLCNNDSKDVGIFAGKGTTRVIFHEPVSQDRMCGLAGMLVLFVFGAIRQVAVVKRSQAAAAKVADLHQPLLKDQV